MDDYYEQEELNDDLSAGEEVQQLEEFQSYAIEDPDIITRRRNGCESESIENRTSALDRSDDSAKEEGVDLTEELVSSCLTDLSRTADGLHIAYLKLSLVDHQLGDIDLLRRFCHVQFLNISHNSIRDISSLSNMTLLEELDVSHNQLSGELLDIPLPLSNLRSADFSFNRISCLPADLSAYQRLQSLQLAGNCIEEMQGLQNCVRLKELNLCNNNIGEICCLDCLPLVNLNLGWNALTRIANLETLQRLQNICLAGNRIRSLQGLECHECLQTVDLSHNEIIDLAEIGYVKDLPMLTELNLLHNPVCKVPDYRPSVLFTASQISTLDTKCASVEEKVAACNLFNPSMELVAAKDHIMHRVYAFLQPQRVSDITLPVFDVSYPMLVLVGPQGVGKKSLAMKLCTDLPEYFGYSLCHTTRHSRSGEENNKDYCFITEQEFENRIKCGQFLQTYTVHGDLYALSLASLESVAESSAVCVTHMELEGVLSMKRLSMRPYFVLLLPEHCETLERRLYEKGHWGHGQIKVILDRVHMYSAYDLQHPGFFDAVIRRDNLNDTYEELYDLAARLFKIPSISLSQQESMKQSHSSHCGDQGQENSVKEWTMDKVNQTNCNSNCKEPDKSLTAAEFAATTAAGDFCGTNLNANGINDATTEATEEKASLNSSAATGGDTDIGVLLDRWGGEWWRSNPPQKFNKGQSLRGNSAPAGLSTKLWDNVDGNRGGIGLGREGESKAGEESGRRSEGVSDRSSKNVQASSSSLSSSVRTSILSENAEQLMEASRRRLEVKIREQICSSNGNSDSSRVARRKTVISQRPGTPHARRGFQSAVVSSNENKSSSQSLTKSTISCPSSAGHIVRAGSRQVDLNLVGLMSSHERSSGSEFMTSERSSVPKCPRPNSKDGSRVGLGSTNQHPTLPAIGSTA